MKYININQKLNFKFCQVPRKILYTEPYKSNLCPLSQLAYIFILDRLNLSRMNNKVDEYGNIYLFITRKEMGEYLKSSSKTVIKVLEDYIETVDYESYYFYKKYYLSGLKDGIKLQEELK